MTTAGRRRSRPVTLSSQTQRYPRAPRPAYPQYVRLQKYL